jgi:hypothetical protein
MTLLFVGPLHSRERCGGLKTEASVEAKTDLVTRQHCEQANHNESKPE